MSRDLRLDFFRGVALIFIFIDHIPENILSYFTLEAFGFFDAAEVFIFISGFTAALVYGRRLAEKGALYATAQVMRRAWQLYVAHVFLFVIFIAEVSYTATTFKNTMYNEEMRVADFLDEPQVLVAVGVEPAFGQLDAARQRERSGGEELALAVARRLDDATREATVLDLEPRAEDVRDAQVPRQRLGLIAGRGRDDGERVAFTLMRPHERARLGKD